MYQYINQNFIIRVYPNQTKTNTLVTANTLSKYINEKLKIKLFNKVLNGKEYKYTFLIRNRLKIVFHSK